jgi:hypothetical protein
MKRLCRGPLSVFDRADSAPLTLPRLSTGCHVAARPLYYTYAYPIFALLDSSIRIGARKVPFAFGSNENRFTGTIRADSPVWLQTERRREWIVLGLGVLAQIPWRGSDGGDLLVETEMPCGVTGSEERKTGGARVNRRLGIFWEFHDR